LKQCASCAREIPDSATLCDFCQEWAVEVANAPLSDSNSPDPQEAQSQSSTTAGVSTPDAVAAMPLGPTPSAPAAKRPSPLIVVGGVAAALVIVVALIMRGGAATPATTTASAGPGGGSPAPASVRPAPATPAALFTRTWSAANSAYWVGNRRRSAAFELPAENIVQVWTRSVRPTLVVRCMAQSTQVFVVTESPMKIEPQTDDHTISYSIDGEPFVSERWPDSDDHDALFAPHGEAFAKRLMEARSFRFGFTPHNMPSVVTDFNVAGLAALLAPASKDCGWKK
jgi:hypothetical protein